MKSRIGSLLGTCLVLAGASTATAQLSLAFEGAGGAVAPTFAGPCPDVAASPLLPGQPLTIRVSATPSPTLPAGTPVGFLLGAGDALCTSPYPALPDLRLRAATMFVLASGAVIPGTPTSLTFVVPPLPAGFTVTLQAAVVDAAAPAGLRFSGARALSVPAGGGAAAGPSTALEIQLSASHGAQFAAAGLVPAPSDAHPEGGDGLTITAGPGSGFDVDSVVCFSGFDCDGGALVRTRFGSQIVVTQLAGGGAKIVVASLPAFAARPGAPPVQVSVANGVVAPVVDVCPPGAAPVGSYGVIPVAPFAGALDGAAAPTSLVDLGLPPFLGPQAYFPVLEGQPLVVDGALFVTPASPLGPGVEFFPTAARLFDPSTLGRPSLVDTDPTNAAVAGSVVVASAVRLTATPPAPPTGATARPDLGPYVLRLRNPPCSNGTAFGPPNPAPGGADVSADLDVLVQSPVAPLVTCFYPDVAVSTGSFRVSVFGEGFIHRALGGGPVVQQFPATIGAFDFREAITPIVCFDEGFGLTGATKLASRVEVKSDVELEIVVPAGLPIGPLTLAVFNPDGQRAVNAQAFSVVPPLTDALAAPAGEALVGPSGPVEFFPQRAPVLPGDPPLRPLDGDALKLIVDLYASRLATPADFSAHLAVDPGWAFPPVIVIDNGGRAADEAFKEGATAVDDPARRTLAFVFNTRRGDGSLRAFDFDRVDLPAELDFGVAPTGAASGIFAGGTTSTTSLGMPLTFAGTTGAPKRVRTTIKAAAFQLIASTPPGGGAPVVEVRWLHEENYPLVVRSRDDFRCDALVELSGDALLGSSPLTGSIGNDFKLRCEYNPAPAGAGLGGRGGSYYRITGSSVYAFDLLKPYDAAALDDDTPTPTDFSLERVLGPPKPPFSLPSVSLSPQSALLDGRPGLLSGVRQLTVSNFAGIPIPPNGGASPPSLVEVDSGGRPGGGVVVAGGQGGGGGGGGHAVVGRNGQAGGGGQTPLGGSFYGNLTSLAGIAGSGAPVAPEAGRPVTFDSEIVGGALLQNYGGLGGTFGGRAASVYDVASPTYPTGLFGGAAASAAPDVDTTAAPLAGLGSGVVPPTFPATLFAGGSGGAGGGASVATFAPWLSIGGRGGNGGGSIVFVSDRIFRLGPAGRLLADGEDGRRGLSVFPVFGEPTFVLSAPGSGGGGAGGVVAVYATADVVAEALVAGTPATALAGAGGMPAVSARGGRGGGTFETSPIPTSDGGEGAHGRVRFAHHEASTRPPADCFPSGPPPGVVLGSWTADFAALAAAAAPAPPAAFSRVTIEPPAASPVAIAYLMPRPTEFAPGVVTPLDPLGPTQGATSTVAVYASAPTPP